MIIHNDKFCRKWKAYANMNLVDGSQFKARVKSCSNESTGTAHG